VYLVLAATLAVAPGGLARAASHVVPTSWGLRPTVAMGYDLGAQLPSAGDRAAGDALVERLRAAPGEVLIPFHPFYAHLAGKHTYLHRMGVLDIGRAGMGSPRGLVEAVAEQRFSLAIFDDKIDGNWYFWPGILERYRIAERIRGPRCVAGADTEPRYVLAPVGVLDREP
jgi:hypothetical protein